MIDQEPAAKKLKMGRQKRFQHQCTYHLENIKKLNPNSLELESFSIEEINDFNFNERIKIAEIRFATFFVEKNLPFSISFNLLFVMKDIAKEPDILQAMSLGRTKLTHIVNNVVCCQETHRISEILRENKFSIYEDETSDITNSKISSFKTKLMEKSPNLITLPCVCHSSALAAKETCKTIPKDNEHFIKTISTFINSNPKRTAIFRNFQIILKMWDMLENFLMEQGSENVYATNNLFLIFQNSTTKTNLFFLEFALDTFNKYNELQPSLMELLFWFFSKFMKPYLLKSARFGHIITTVNFSDLNKFRIVFQSTIIFYIVLLFSIITALFEYDRESTVLKVLQVNRRLGKLVGEDEKKKNSMSIETLNSICVIKYTLRANDKTACTVT
ncbi:hypothetical protein ACFW04_013601 [Cataglyphis niger]